jgi:phosphoribosyl-AMP cyclohydrolase
VSKAAITPGSKSQADIEEGTAFAPKFDADGLIPVVATSAETGEVLMLAYMNEEAIARTIERITGRDRAGGCGARAR